MESIGILYELKPSNSKEPSRRVEADLHINYLKTLSKDYYLWKKYDRSLDIGVMLLTSVADIKSISIYLPFRIKKEDVLDLGAVIRDPNLFCTLFNEDYTISNVPNHPLFHTVVPTTKQNAFWLYTIEQNTFSIDDSLQLGSLLTISIAEIPPCTFVQEIDRQEPGLYFRLRINRLPKNEFYYEDHIANDVFQSAFSKAEIVDFRVNEMREFDNKVIDDLKNGRYFVEFRKFHFFFIGSSEDEEIVGSTDCTDTRLLDPKRWASYNSSIRRNRIRYIAYHWSKKAEQNSTFTKCSVFLKTKYKSVNIEKMLKYCSIVIFLGFIGSVLCAVLMNVFNILSIG